MRRLLHFPQRCASMSFAYPIKQMVCYLIGESVEKWDDREWRETQIKLFGKSPRELAQTIGTEWGRNCVGPDMWLDLALSHIDFANEQSKWCITDVRFRNEADRIRTFLGGHIIHVHRVETDCSNAAQGHLSEEGIGRSCTEDFHINNFGTVEQLEEQVKLVVARVVALEKERLVDAVSIIAM